MLLESLSEREFGVSFQDLLRIWPERPVLILRKVPPPLTIPFEKKRKKKHQEPQLDPNKTLMDFCH